MKETIRQHQVPEDVLQEVNDFLEEIMVLQLEEESADEEVTDESNKNCIDNGSEKDGEKLMVMMMILM